MSGLIAYVLLLEFEGASIPDVVADVFFVDQNLMDRRAGPRAAKIGGDAPLIELGRDLALGFSVLRERTVDPSHDFDFFFGPGD